MEPKDATMRTKLNKNISSPCWSPSSSSVAPPTPFSKAAMTTHEGRAGGGRGCVLCRVVLSFPSSPAALTGEPSSITDADRIHHCTTPASTCSRRALHVLLPPPRPGRCLGLSHDGGAKGKRPRARGREHAVDLCGGGWRAREKGG